MEDSLERRQESYDGTHFAFLQKLDDFEITVLAFSWKGGIIFCM